MSKLMYKVGSYVFENSSDLVFYLYKCVKAEKFSYDYPHVGDYSPIDAITNIIEDYIHMGIGEVLINLTGTDVSLLIDKEDNGVYKEVFSGDCSFIEVLSNYSSLKIKYLD